MNEKCIMIILNVRNMNNHLNNKQQLKSLIIIVSDSKRSELVKEAC